MLELKKLLIYTIKKTAVWQLVDFVPWVTCKCLFSSNSTGF